MNYLMNGFEEELEKIAFLKKKEKDKGKEANRWRLRPRLTGHRVGAFAGFLTGLKLIDKDLKSVSRGFKRPNLAMYAKAVLPITAGAFLGDALESKIYRKKFGKNNRKYSK